MTGRTIKVLGVHGLGDHRDGTWMPRWTKAIEESFPLVEGDAVRCDYLNYDDIFFDETDLSGFEIARALWKLSKSGIGSFGRRDRGFLDKVAYWVQKSAGYVVAWVEDDEFQQKTRSRLLETIIEEKPDVLIAHSLGSLIAYNALSHAVARDNPELSSVVSKMILVTIGSQVGNPFVIGNLTTGRLDALPVAFWHHCYNKHDSVFTRPINLANADNFQQTDTPFDIEGAADHAADSYISHPAAIDGIWRPICHQRRIARSFSGVRALRARPAGVSGPSRRALLVGINAYPNEQDRLEGCVNDVFKISAVLQECGFKPEEIRTCLDSRATADGILERLEWLLDEPASGAERVFYFSGHGAQIPEYGEHHEPDRLLETLVPWDFDWTRETAITDDRIFQWYSQLPYDMRLALIFDACHSGGMTRSGSSRPKGLSPPDDIRHRELKWDRKTKMWVSRSFRRLNKDFSDSARDSAAFFGKDGATERLGRATMLRTMSVGEYKKAKKKQKDKPVGPYLPLIIQACAENELAYEYVDGVTSYGAFTYSLVSILRRKTQKGKKVTFEQLVKLARNQLKDLQYDQVPQILGPTAIKKARVPWLE
ncbi:caspase family protein [Hoeflea prorocentri]|uniref:Caspase family protein n=1 Tax=Hoeflea prorocentri TaxID=1922333 RepID=A0A9X3UL63_9HYPH|nr:caspase family protein [Hoeflea prorocentri]MCY6382445.1 caspase family protein [Hoeflea prorocentri]MDA5400245.1 caspase family protein [Hoeflea prorocentri]